MFSRHSIQLDRGRIATMGFDNPLQTFFLNIEDSDGELIHFIGDTPDEIPNIDDFIKVVDERFGIKIDGDLRAKLEFDKARSPGRTPTQEFMISMLKKGIS